MRGIKLAGAVLLMMLVCIWPQMAMAQNMDPPPAFSNVDGLNIDLTVGQPMVGLEEGSIGPADGGLKYQQTWSAGAGRTDN